MKRNSYVKRNSSLVKVPGSMLNPNFILLKKFNFVFMFMFIRKIYLLFHQHT